MRFGGPNPDTSVRQRPALTLENYAEATMASVRTRRGVRMSHTLQCSAAEGAAYAFWAYFASLADVLETPGLSIHTLDKLMGSRVSSLINGNIGKALLI